MPFEVLDPTHELDAALATRAPRLAALDGAVVGIISNGKEGTRPFFDHVESILRERHGVAEVVRTVKPNLSAPAPDDIIRQALGWSAVLAGVGD
jgi:hypothetical protein